MTMASSSVSPTSLFWKMIRRYLDHLYSVAARERRQMQAVVMEPNPTAHLLDCGCREGDNTSRLAKLVGTHYVVGLDYNVRMLHQAAQKGILPLRADLNRAIPLGDMSVDVIIASDVLEHLVSPNVFVGELHRVLRPDGYVILDTPNLASWHNIFALLIGTQPFSGPNITTMEDADVELVRQMHRSTHGLLDQGEYVDRGEQELTRHIVVVAYLSLIKLFRYHGFVVEETYGFGYYPFPPFLARLLQRLDPRHAHHILLKARKPV